NKDIFFELIKPITKGQYIHSQGVDSPKGDVLLSKNTFIRGIEIGILASVGKTMVKVFEYPKIWIVSTGD
ncbi:MAG: hypothetical protein ACRCR9_03140, partial [Chitinophagaceae bacterium]